MKKIYIYDVDALDIEAGQIFFAKKVINELGTKITLLPVAYFDDEGSPVFGVDES